MFYFANNNIYLVQFFHFEGQKYLTYTQKSFQQSDPFELIGKIYRRQINHLIYKMGSEVIKFRCEPGEIDNDLEKILKKAQVLIGPQSGFSSNILDAQLFSLVDLEEQSPWEKYNMNKLSPLIKSWTISTLKLDQFSQFYFSNSHPQILKQISHISFRKLEILSLKGNKLTSIQGLARMNLPNLQILDISNNNITRMCTIRKSSWSRLSRIEIGLNFLKDMQKFPETHVPRLAQLLIGEELLNWQSSDLRWTIKINSSNCYIAWKHSLLRIPQKLLSEKLRQKWSCNPKIEQIYFSVA